MTQTNASATSLKRAWTLSLPSQRREALDLAKWLIEEGSPSISITVEHTPEGGLAVTELTFRTLVGGPSLGELSARLQALSSPRLTSHKVSVESSTGLPVRQMWCRGSNGEPTLISLWPP